jgi:hypothetical protein
MKSLDFLPFPTDRIGLISPDLVMTALNMASQASLNRRL